MASYTAADFTDDEDTQDEVSSGPTEEEQSIDESSNLESEDSSYVDVSKRSSLNLTGAIKKKFSNSNSSEQRNKLVVSDRHSSSKVSKPLTTPVNKGRSSKHRNSSRNKSTDSPPIIEHSKNHGKYRKRSVRENEVELNSDSDEDIGFKMKTRKNVIESDSGSESETTEHTKNLTNDATINVERNEVDSRHRASFMKMRSSAVYSDTDEDVDFRTKNKRNVIESDSESELENINIVNESSEKEQTSCSIEAITSDPDIEEVAKSLNMSRISTEFNFGKKGHIVNSTLLDIENQLTPQPGSKRLFNKSADTPRILKQLKESSTPITTPAKTIKEEIDPLKTPRSVKAAIPSPSPSSSSVEILSDEDIIDVSSGDASPQIPCSPVQFQPKVTKQTTLDAMFVKKKAASPEAKGENKSDNVIEVSPKELAEQKFKVRRIESDLLKAQNLLRTVNLDGLPDKGKLIKERHAAIETMLKGEIAKLSKMVASKEDPPDVKTELAKQIGASWDEIQAKVNDVMPKTFGKRAISTYNAQKALTMDRLQQLHGSLETCPKENTLEKDPKGLKVELMPHQRRALAWLMWREKQKPSGGILADDMGLGKTLTMISLMLKTLESEEEEESDTENRPDQASKKFNGGTLVVCPASLLNQWSGELEKRTRRGLASCELYHGPKRETQAKRLARHNMVITTYAIVMNECEKDGAVFRVKWRRIVVDEAHQIRNYKSQTSEAVCRLSARSRWALTGTPVHNKELDMYALLKFLRCTPFDDLQVWKRWVGDKSTGGQERLHTVISSLMLRRTKAELMEKGSLQAMPQRKWELITVQLSKNEMDVYQKILLFSRTLFAQFLHQRAEKNQDMVDLQHMNFNTQPNGPNQEYFKMREKLLRFHKVRDIKQHEILVLLLRLRQICCHPSLIINMLHEDMEDLDEDGNPEEINILDQLNKMVLNDDQYDPDVNNPAEGLADEANAPKLSEAAKSLLNPSNPVFSTERLSSKIKVALDVIKERIVNTNDKAIIVSQWPSFLRLIAYHLKKEFIPFDQLDGSIPVNKRMIMVDRFNDPNDKMKILLLSLTAGGVGLNLVGANHLFLLDLHWNPQLENQAQDRIYRMGQQKPVFVYKFMATDTIEKRILDLQEKKLDIANSMLTGTKQVIASKLSLQDLKLLFDM